MSGRYLNASELVQARNEASSELPQGGGIKADEPDGSWLQKRKLEVFFEERSSVLQEERIHLKGSLTTGEWCPRENKVILTSKPFHQFWKVMGHHVGGKQWLYPEEALFLMDEGVLQILYGGVPWSMQQAYMAITGSHLAIEHYQVYSHLCRLGYIVQRHTTIEIISEYERQIGLDKIRGKRRINAEESCGPAKKIKQHLANDPGDQEDKVVHETSDTANEAHADSHENIECSSRDAVDTETSAHVPRDSFTHQSRSWFAAASSFSDKLTTHTTHKSHLNPPKLDSVKFPNLAEVDGNKVTIEAPHPSLLPEGISLSEKQYTLLCGPRLKNNSKEEELEFSNPPSRNVTAATNWQQWKEEIKGMYLRQNRAADVLFRGNMKPLVTPNQAVSNGAVLEALKIIPESCDLSRSLESENANIVFDVFLPNANFKKSNPGLPNIHVCVTRQEEMAPSLSDILRLREQCADGVPLQWAVVDNGDIAFYSFNEVSLPTDVSSI